MSNGQPYYGGGSGDTNSVANNSGFGGATMGGGGQAAYGTQRPQFGIGTQPESPHRQGSGMMTPPPPQQQQHPNPPGTPQQGYSMPYNASAGQPSPSPANNGAGYQTPQQQQGPGGHPAGSGSITRFANASQPQQQQQQQQQPPGGTTPLYPQSSPYSFQPPPQPAAAAGGGAGMSFAQRGAMLAQQQQPPVYGQQPQPSMNNRYAAPASQQQQQQTAPPANMAGMSFAQRSDMMLRQNPPPTSNVYGGGMQQPPQQPQPQMGYGAPQQQQQQQPPPQQSQYPQPPRQQQYQQQPPSTPQSQQQRQPQLGGSMMGSPQGPPPQQQPQQQQQPQYGGMQQQPGMAQQSQLGGSYAQRSTMMGGQSQMGGGMPQQQQAQPQMGMPPPAGMPGMGMPPSQPPPKPNIYVDPPEVVAQQNRLLTDATRKVQEHAYYMKQAMERNDLPTVLDRAAQMVGELGEHAHSHHHHHVHPPAPGATGSTTALSPKNYYELHLRALEELPTLEDYLLNIAQAASQPNNNMMSPGAGPMMMTPGMMPQQQQQQQPLPAGAPPTTFSMKELYDYVQYCPNVLSRLYLQICAASALIRSGEVGARWVLKDMVEAVKCVQNPVRGLFLRHYLLQAIRDKLPNEPIPGTQVVPYGMAAPASAGTPATPAPAVVAEVTSVEKGTVKDSYEFILANFVEMNKLWVRIQHLPGDGKSKEIRRRREKDRNELRILVGTNLVRLSALDSVTSQIYGQVILPTVLDHIIISGDPLAQAYLIDCIVQVFPDEYHIETMPILLAACPKLRDKVNIRTILQSLMDRLANYLADEELLDEEDSNQVKRNMANDSFRMIDECVQSVYNARGPKLQAKEVIRLQTSLLSFSMKCYRGNLEQITLCLDNCVVALQQARANQALMQEARAQNFDPNAPRVLPQLEQVATKELEKLLSIPLDELALGVLTLDHYANLIGFLPWANRRQLALTMLEAVNKAGTSPESVKEIEELFSVIAPVLRDERDMAPGQNNMAAQNPSMDRTTNLMAGLGVSPQLMGNGAYGQPGPGFPPPQEDPQYRKDAALVSKLIHLLNHENTDVQFEMLSVARHHLNAGKIERTGTAYMALVFSGLKLAKRILLEEIGEMPNSKKSEDSKEEEMEDNEEAKEVETPEATPRTTDEDGETKAEDKEEEEDSPPEETQVETVEDDKDDEEKPKTEVEDPSSNDETKEDAPQEVTEVPRTVRYVDFEKLCSICLVAL
jgi:vacuolar protein sorting-associated protein 35